MVVAVGEHIRFHLHQIADDALNGKAAPVDLGLDAFDHDALPSIRGFLHGFDQLSGRPVPPGVWRTCRLPRAYQLRNYTDNEMDFPAT